jgi:hypothetical protein
VHSFRVPVSAPWIDEGSVRIDHNSDWSGDVHIRWNHIVKTWADGSGREIAERGVVLPGCIIKALIDQTNGIAIERIRDLLEQLETGR